MTRDTDTRRMAETRSRLGAQARVAGAGTASPKSGLTSPITPKDDELIGVGLGQVRYILKSVANGDDQSRVASKAALIVEQAASRLTELKAERERRDKLLEMHVQRCRDAVSECPNWSPAQAEWSRARDALLNYRDDISALSTPGEVSE